MISVRCYPYPALVRLLSAHAGFSLVASSLPGGRVEIEQGSWRRGVVVGDPSVEVSGLVELMDNNPMVCGDVVGVPGPVATLALVALGPLVRAGLLLDDPVMQVAGAVEGEDVDGFLAGFGWGGSVALSFGDESFGNVVAANVVAEIATPSNWDEIDELYRECYAHSFYVRESGEVAWDTSLVLGRPYACYRLGCTVGDQSSLLTVQVMADRDGKCGAAQIVHAMNVMCGFEECDGIGDSL